MHELPFTKSIFRTVSAKAAGAGAEGVSRVVLEVGVLRDYIPEIVQKYWDYVAKGTIAEGAEIEINTIPATVRCRDCGHVYGLDVRNMQESHCPECGCVKGELETGRELRIIGIEIF